MLQNQAEHKGSVDLEVRGEHLAFDPVQKALFTQSNHKTYVSTNSGEGKLITQPTAFLASRLSTEERKELAKRQSSGKKSTRFMQFTAADNVTLDITKLTARVSKVDPVMTNLKLGTRSLVFEVHEVCTSGGIRFLVKGETESVFNQDIKAEAPTTYTFHWDAEHKTLNLYIRRTKKASLIVKSPGLFGIVPLQAASVYTINPYKSFFINQVVSEETLLVACELKSEQIEAFDGLLEANVASQNKDFQVIKAAENESKTLRIYLLKGTLTSKPALPTEIADHTVVEFNWTEDLKSKATISEELKTFIKSKKELFNRGYDWSATVTPADTLDLGFGDQLTTYVKATDSLVFYSDNSIKLIKRKGKAFPLSKTLFDDAVLSLDGQTSVEIDAVEAQLLISGLKDKRFSLEDTAVVPQVEKFITKLVGAAAGLTPGQSVVLKGQFKQLWEAVIILVTAFSRNIALPEQLCSLMNQKKRAADSQSEVEAASSEAHEVMNALFDEPVVEDKTQDPVATQALQYIQKSSTKMIIAARVLLEIYEQLRAKSQFISEELDACEVGLGYSAQFRLTSFVLSKYIGRDFQELANNGLYNSYNTLCQLNHHLYEDRPISGLDSADNRQESIYSVFAQNGIDLREDVALLNVDLATYVNNSPAVNFVEGTISRVEVEPNYGTLCVYFESGELRLFDTTVGLVELFRGNIRDNSHKSRVRCNLVEKKNKFLINLADSVPETVFNAIAEYKKPLTSEENPLNIIPDPQKLDQIYKMGFSLDLAKRALIKAKNQSVDAAVELLLSMDPSAFEQDEENLKQAVSLIKPEWTCQVCTYINVADNMGESAEICLCGTPAPLDAYYSKEEVEELKEVQAQMVAAQKEQEELQAQALRKTEEAQNELESLPGVVSSLRISSLRHNFMSRYLVALGCNSEDKDESTLRIRRIGYCHKYIKSLLRDEVDGVSSVTILAVGNQVVLESEHISQEQVFSDLISGEHRIQVDSLVPSLAYEGRPMATIDQQELTVEGKILQLFFDEDSTELVTKINETSSTDKKTTSTKYEEKHIYVLTKSSAGVVTLSKFRILVKLHDFFDPQSQIELVQKLELGAFDTVAEFLATSNANTISVLVGKVIRNFNKVTLEQDGEATAINHSVNKTFISGDQTFGVGDTVIQLTTQVQSTQTIKSIEGSVAVTSPSGKQLTCDDILNFLHNRQLIQFEVEGIQNALPILPEAGPAQFTHCAKIIPVESDQNLTFNLLPKESSDKNNIGMISLSLVLSPTEAAPAPTAPEAPKLSDALISSANLDKSEEEHSIPLRVAYQSFDGVNHQSFVGSSVFAGPGAHIFSGKRAETNFVFFENQYELDMIIKQLTLQSKAAASDDSIESALVFTTNSTGIVSKFDLRFLGKVYEYKNWLKTKPASTEKWEEWEPVAYLSVGDGKAIQELDHVRSAKYLCLVFNLGNNKKQPTFRLNQISAKGSCLQRSEKSSVSVPKPTKEVQETGFTLTVLNGQNPIQAQKKLMVDGTQTGLNLVINLNFYEQLSALKFFFNRQDKVLFNIESISVQIIKRSSGEESGLKELFENQDKLVGLLQSQSKRLSMPDIDFEEKKKILELILDISNEFSLELIDQIQQSLDIDYLVGNLILQRPDQDFFRNVNNFIEKFKRSEHFAERLSASFAKHLEKIELVELSVETLKNFFRLIDASISHPKFAGLKQNLQDLITKSLAKLDETITIEHKVLQGLGVQPNIFDPTSFWNLESPNLSGSKFGEDFSDFYPSAYLTVKSINQIEIYCDLGKETTIGRLLLKFFDISILHFDIFPFLTLEQFDLGPNLDWNTASKKQIFGQRIDHSFLMFSNKTARQQGVSFYCEKYWYNALGYKLQGITGRFFRIKLHFDTSLQAKSFYKLSKHSLQPFFFPSTGAQLPQHWESGFVPVLPDLPINASANVSNGELSIVKTVSNTISLDSSSAGRAQSRTNAQASAAPSSSIPQPQGDKGEASSAAVEEPAQIPPLVRLQRAIEEIRLSLKDVKVALMEPEEVAYLISTLEGITNERDNLEKSTHQLAVGQNSFNFWITILDLAGSNPNLQKCSSQLTLDHCKSALRNVISLKVNPRVRDIVLQLLKKSAGLEKPQASLKTLRKLVEFITTSMSVAQYPGLTLTSLIQTLHGIFSEQKHFPVYDLADHILTKLCSNYSESKPEQTITQMSCFFDLIFLFNTQVKKEVDGQDKEDYASEIANTTLNILLWVYEQESLSKASKDALSDKAIKLFIQIFTQAKQVLIKTFKLEKGLFEMLWLRSLKLGVYKSLEPLYTHLVSLASVQDSNELATALQNLNQDVLSQVVTHLKGDESKNIREALKDEKLEESTIYDFMGFLFRNLDIINKQLNSRKKETVPATAAKPEEVKISRKRTVEDPGATPTGATATRSLSINSVEKPEEESASDLIIKDVIQLYKKKLADSQGVGIPTLFIETAKLVFSKSNSKEFLKSFIDLYLNHKVCEKSLITNELLTLISETMEHLRKNFTGENENNKVLREFSSNLIVILVEHLTARGIEHLDSEEIKFIIFVQELLFGAVEAKKGMAATIKTLTSHLTIGCVSKVFYSTAKELSRLCNWGGPDGYDSLEKYRLNYLDILMNFLAIINAASSGSKSLTLNDMVANLKSTNLTEVMEAIYQLLEWNVFNNITTAKKSPAADRLLKISGYIDQILKAIGDNPEAGKIMIKKVFDIVNDIHSFLLPKIGQDQLNFVVINITYNLFVVLEHVLESTLKDNHMINYFIVECKGIHFVFDLLHLSYSANQAIGQELAKESASDDKAPHTPKSDQLHSMKKSIQDILEKHGLSKLKAASSTSNPGVTAATTTLATPAQAAAVSIEKAYLLQTPSSTVPAQAAPASAPAPMPVLNAQNYKTYIPCVTPEKFSDEFGKDLKCLTKINGKEEKTVDWAKNKKVGSKQILLYTMQNDFTKNSREWVLDFQLNGPADLKTIKAGFLAQFNDHGSKTIAEPSYIIIHYKCKESDPWRYLCDLERFEDNGYASSATACYQKNFMRFEGTTFQDRMESVCIPKRIEFLRFLIGKPTVSIQEGYSPIKNKDANQFVLAPSYISILGINSKQYNLVQLTNYIKETSLLKLLHKVFSKDQKSFDSVSSQSDLITKFKTIFERLMDDYVELFTTPLVSFARTNQDLALWVMDKLLDLKFKEEHTKVIGEVVMASPEHYAIRVSILCDFILREIAACVNQNKDVQERLFSFMGVFSSCITRGQKELKEVTTLNVGEPEVNLLIKFFNKTSVVQQFKSFFITLINLPNPGFTLKIKDPMAYLLVELSNKICTDEDFIVAELLSLVALSKPQFAQRLIEDNIMDILFKKLHLMEGKPRISVLLFFRNCINHSVCLRKAISLKLIDNLFDYLKTEVENENSNPPSTKFTTLAPLHLDIIKYIVSIDEESRQNCAEIILNYFKGIATNQKEVLYFLETVILPILFTVRTNKVFFSKKAPARITLGVEDNTQSEDPLKGFKLKSDYIPAAMVPTLISSTDQLLDDSTREKFRTGNWECIASTAKLGKSDLSPQIEESLIGQGPFMIIIDGEASNQEYVLGIFCSTGIPADTKGKPGSRDLTVSNSDNHFMFLYERSGEQTTCHYKTKASNETETFLKFTDKADATEKGIFVYFDRQEKVIMSFTDPASNHIDLYPMKCLDTDPKPNFEFPYDFHIKRGIEIWRISKPPTDAGSKESKGSIFSMGLLSMSNELFNISYSYYRNATVYNLPSTVPLNVVKKVLFNDESLEFASIPSGQTVDDKLTIEELKSKFPPQDPLDILDLEYTKDVDVKETTMTALKDSFLAETPVLDHFIKIEGFDLILTSCQNIISVSPVWQEKTANAASWEQILKEIRYYAKIPQFIPVFAANSQSIQTLFKIMSQAKLAEKVWVSCEETINTTIYSALQKVFMQFNDPSLRELTIQEGILGSILDKLAAVSKETKRKWTEVTEVKPEVIKEVKKTETSDNPNAIVKRKGVGYENGVTNTNWSTEEFFKLAEAKNKKIKGLLQIILSIFDQQTWGWQPPEPTFNILCESCLLPLIENNLRCTSLLDWVKEKELYELYLNIILALSKVEKLLPTLVQLDEKYKPSQTASIEKLLSNLYNSAETFKRLTPAEILNAKADDPNRIAYGLAEKIMNTYESLAKSISQSSMKDRNALDAATILQLPMEDQYRLLLEKQRFGYVNMKDPNDETKYIHHWKGNFVAKYLPSPAKMGRLAQEVADISNSLTCESTNAMFVRADEERLDVMKAIIFGAEGCPYAHGAFEYHIYFDNDYPAGPPKVNLETTGNGDVRFNPNLYSCGKVCLSLLGTWRGSASESWDPKFSTLSQVLVSIQAVVMSEEVYFNEPNYGHEAGTEQGELRNNGYSNIVRLCNVKHAMIGQIENPPKGFELVVRAHFALKKEKILKTVKEWIKWSTEKDASYSNLVSDHNQSYAERFKNKPTAYAEELAVAVTKLEKILDSLEMPPIDQLLGSKVSQVKITRGKQDSKAITEGQAKIEEIDMTYDENVQHKSMANDEAGVMDRWSRYIGVMGLESVTKQANASVLISGLNSLGVEVAKNIVLSGAKRVTLHDSKVTTWNDLSGQFFLTEADIGKNRAAGTISKLQQLNFYVKVDELATQAELPHDEDSLEKLGLKDYEVIVLIDNRHATIAAVSKLCRKHNRALVVADCHGIFSRVFCDFGPKFVCFDKNGEEPPEVMIANITSEENGKVTLLEGVKHMFEDGETIMIRGVEGMRVLEGFKPQVPEGVEVPTSINGMLFKVKAINFNSFFIGDTKGFDKYVRGGLAKLVKVPQDVPFEPYHEVYNTATPKFEPNLEFHDFMKVDHPRVLHLGFLALDDFYAIHKRLPQPYSLADAKEILALVQKRQESTPDFLAADKLPIIKKVISRFAMTLGGNFGPQSAFIGGIVCQEIVKAITGKFKPIVQTLYADSMEVLDDSLFPENIFEMPDAEFDALVEKSGVKTTNHRDDGVRILLGANLLQKVKDARLFMVGSGAIGCELLKNYAMIGLGTGKPTDANKTGGQIILTDPDVIEVSNLNRQFLFREKHLRKPKSVTAAAAAQLMNPELQGRLVARLDKVHEGTSNIFTDKFFRELTVVTNALDNVQARKYIDSRCVTARTPLLESGTLGPKGHVQVVIPNKTESYGSMNDPTEEVDIPHCTLKMFPEETLHCVEWARDLFGSLFTQAPQALRKCLEEQKSGSLAGTDPKALKDAVKLASKAPNSFNDCITFARYRFQKYFHNDILQLLYVYPLDFKDKDGNPFWKLPKRPPTPITYDPANKLHRDFIVSMAALRAKIFSIALPPNIREEAGKNSIALVAADIKVDPFTPSDEKAKEISKDVEKLNKPKDVQPEESTMVEGEMIEAKQEKEDTPDSLQDKLKAAGGLLSSDKIAPEEFEKDDDKNYHIDAIYAMANLRANNYKLDEMDWITVKIKAGRIVPALATTTASIAGLQTIEVVKVLKEIKVEHIKNAFLNIAVPILTQSEPAEAPKIKLNDKVTVSLWDRWEFKDCAKRTLAEIFTQIEQDYGLYPRDVLHGAKSIFMRALSGSSDALSKPLGDFFGAAPGEHEDVTITCSLTEADNKLLTGVPTVRLLF